MIPIHASALLVAPHPSRDTSAVYPDVHLFSSPLARKMILVTEDGYVAQKDSFLFRPRQEFPGRYALTLGTEVGERQW